MGAITYKCPNCGGELMFDPSSQKYLCEYCGSQFSQEELDSFQPTEGGTYADTTEEEVKQEKQAGMHGTGAGESAVMYSCPSCGAEIVTTETTAATFCYYCHNPVVLKGRLSDEYLPDSVIPFQIDKNSAVETFKKFVKKKKFVPRGFSSDSQIEKLTGVYYPYWVYDADVDADLDAKATQVHVSRLGDEEITETKVYEVHRGGRIRFGGMTRNALKSDHREMVENVQPYSLEKLKPFSMGYLSGFQAERRDMEKTLFTEELQKEVRSYSEKLLMDQVSGYTTVERTRTTVVPKDERWRYCLLPAWILTYRTSGGNTYYFALNGQTGEVAGKLPIDKVKLGIYSLVTGGVLTGLISAILYFVV